MSDPYAANKIEWHPDVLKDMRSGGPGHLLTVHIMPQNVCNQRCSFCSYRLKGNKNSESFDETQRLPEDCLEKLLNNLAWLGVKGVEVTGGGEPLAYPYTEKLWSLLNEVGFSTALVTNGTLLHKHDVSLITKRMKWARVSIDCATQETYEAMRGSKRFMDAWEAVAKLRESAPEDQDFRLGVGFVLSNENVGELYGACKLAKEFGADNVRLSVTYSSQGWGYYTADARVEINSQDFRDQITMARELEDESFKVHDLISRRLGSMVGHMTQDYEKCPTKDLLCVIEGSGKVYPCCTLTGMNGREYGNFLEHERGLLGVWGDSQELRDKWDCREACKVPCLYREQNLAMNRIIDAKAIHTEFI